MLTILIQKNTYFADDALIELAQKAGFFIVTVVELASIISLSDTDLIKSVIEGLTKCVLASDFLSRSDEELSQRNEPDSRSCQEDFLSKNGEAPSQAPRQSRCR